MAYSLENTTDLIALGNAIREKTGDNETMTIAEMTTAVADLEVGGGAELDLPDTIVIKNLAYLCQEGRFDWALDNEEIYDRLQFGLARDYYRPNSTQVQYAFQGIGESQTGTIHFYDLSDKTIYITDVNGYTLQYFFNNAQYLRELPSISVWEDSRNNYHGCTNMSYIFAGAENLNKISSNFFDNVTIHSGAVFQGICQNCYRLKSIPNNFLAEKIYNIDPFSTTNMSRSIFVATFQNCYNLQAIYGMPYHSSSSTTINANNYTLNTFQNCYMLRHLTFYMPNNQIGTFNAKGITFDLTTAGSGFVSQTYMDTSEYVVLTAENYLTEKDNLNAYNTTQNVGGYVYNRQSAIETINSLPDTTAGGGVNTIKFKADAGSWGGDLYNMSKLSESEIAVATAKGWTVAII